MVDDQHQPVGQPAPDQQRVADEAADHHELALGEVHDVGRLEDQDEPERDERVHAAGGEPADDLAGQDLDHALTSRADLLCSSVQSLIFTHLPSFTTTRRPRVAHAAAVVTAVAVLEAPARIPVLDRLDRLEHGVTGEVRPGALHGLHEQRRLLVAVEIGRVDRQAREVLGHVGPVLVEERAGLGGQRIDLDAHHAPPRACRRARSSCPARWARGR